MKRWLYIALFAGIFVLGIQFIQPQLVSANSRVTAPSSAISLTRITINDPGTIYQRKPFIIQGTFKDEFGYGIANKHIAFTIDGARLGQTKTNAEGFFQLPVDRSISPGTHLITASYPGERVLAPAKSTIYIQILPATELTLTEIADVPLGSSFTVSGSLTDLSSGKGIPDQVVSINMDGNHIATATTDNQGNFKEVVNKAVNAASHLLSVSFNGEKHIAPATGYVLLNVLPSKVTVQTIPPLQGITFSMDGRTFVSGADGLATIDIYKAGKYRLDALVNQYSNPNQRIEFGRWEQESFQPYRTVQVPTDSNIEIGLNVYRELSLSFVDLENSPVDNSRITAVTIRSLQGDVFDLKAGQSRWLPASRIARRQTGLQEVDLLYSVINVTIDGSNVVNSSQQRFYLDKSGTWSISLLLYSLHLTARDGLFASPIGRSINLQFPNGDVKNYPLNNDGSVDISSLARGIYHVTLVGASGMGTTLPVALSRQQFVKMNVITPLDMGVVGLLGAFVFFGLIFYGRPWLLWFILRRNRLPRSHPRLLDAYIHEN